MDTKVCVKVKSLDKTPVNFCGFDGLCPVPSESNDWTTYKEGEKIKLVANEKTDLDIHWIAGALEGAIVSCKTEVSAWIPGKESEKISFTLVLTNDEELLPVAGISADKSAVVTVANGFLNYDFATPAARTLSVYGLDGSRVMGRVLEAAHGQVSLDELPAGLWLYAIEGADVHTSGKIMIKK